MGWVGLQPSEAAHLQVVWKSRIASIFKINEQTWNISVLKKLYVFFSSGVKPPSKENKSAQQIISFKVLLGKDIIISFTWFVKTELETVLAFWKEAVLLFSQFWSIIKAATRGHCDIHGRCSSASQLPFPASLKSFRIPWVQIQLESSLVISLFLVTYLLNFKMCMMHHSPLCPPCFFSAKILNKCRLLLHMLLCFSNWGKWNLLLKQFKIVQDNHGKS